MEEFDKDTIKNLRVEIDAALAAIAVKHGIQIRAGNATFSPEFMTMKLEFSTLQNGKPVTKEAEALKLYAPSLGLTPEHLAKNFVISGVTYRLVGFCPRKQKFPMVCERTSDGKRYGLPEDVVLKALGVETPTATLVKTAWSR
jgi:hypothetical protein